MKTPMRLLLIPALLTVTACSGLGEALGLDRSGPDEYNVAPQPPLAIPPDFTLRPPEPGAARPQSVSAETKAKAALLGTTSTVNDVNSAALGAGGSAEQAMLNKTKNYATRSTGDSIPQPEAMQVLSKATNDAAAEIPVSVGADEKLKAILDAPTTPDNNIQMKPEDKPFWDSWF